MTVTADVRTVENVIGGEERAGRRAAGRSRSSRRPPASAVSLVARSSAEDVAAAVAAAEAAQPAWAARPVEERGRILRRVAQLLERDRERVAAVVSAETGKSPKDAKGETDGAIELGYFIAGEGRRFYGRTMPSATPNRSAMTIRQPLGVAGLIIAANTPIANVAWKVFPALLCGNAAVLKASEDAPETANVFARLAAEAGVPDGVLNVVHGFGEEAGQPLVEDPRVAVVSFTGSTAVGRLIARVAGERLAKVCLELGGKNPLVVCDDANLEQRGRGGRAVGVLERRPALRRRLAADRVRRRLRPLPRAAGRAGAGAEGRAGRRARLRPGDQRAAARAHAGRGRAGEGGGRDGASRAASGSTGRASTSRRRSSRAPPPTPRSPAPSCSGRSRRSTASAGSRRRSQSANASPYGLTAAIWTASIHRGQEFVRRIVAGGVQVNGPTYGFEPHVPFGGQRDSGTGWREPGTEALDVYSDWKTVYVTHDPAVRLRRSPPPYRRRTSRTRSRSGSSTGRSRRCCSSCSRRCSRSRSRSWSGRHALRAARPRALALPRAAHLARPRVRGAQVPRPARGRARRDRLEQGRVRAPVRGRPRAT